MALDINTGSRERTGPFSASPRNRDLRTDVQLSLATLDSTPLAQTVGVPLDTTERWRDLLAGAAVAERGKAALPVPPFPGPFMQV